MCLRLCAITLTNCYLCVSRGGHGQVWGPRKNPGPGTTLLTAYSVHDTNPEHLIDIEVGIG